MKCVLPTLPDERLASDPEAGLGALATERGCLPLKVVDVQARIEGLLARVQLTQTFVNVHDVPLEATYIFPLPDRAAVTRFRLHVAGRVIEGQLRERGAARREYDHAVRKGRRAAITEEERPGVFSLRVGNLPPGEAATVELTLAGPLPYQDGEATFRFPLVVAPRYIPGVVLPGTSVGDGTAPDTDAVPDASRISPPVLLPGFPNPVRLSLGVEIAPSPLLPRDFRSSLHTVAEEVAGPDEALHFRLLPGERLNRDFILRFRLGETDVGTSLSLQPDADGAEGTFLLTVLPPTQASGIASRPRDLVFVLDRSGSMGGWKMTAARRALARMVDTLTERDRFTVLAFDDRVEMPASFRGALQPGSDRQRFRAVEFLTRIEARGGTALAGPLERAVTLLEQADREPRERILVLVTDGQVGNEDQILRHLGSRLKKLRVFTLGIDQAVNAAFLRRLSDLGGGASALVESEARLDEVMDSVHRQIGAPVLTDLRLESAGLGIIPGSVVPGRLPDLFAGTPVQLLGRYRGRADGAVILEGRTATGEPWSARVSSRMASGAALPSVWARARLRELEDLFVSAGGERTALEQEIVATSLRFGVLCRFTAYVAVDLAEVVNPGGVVHGIVQPVEQPAGWTGAVPACARAPAAAPSTITGELIPPQAAKKTMLAKQVLSELNTGGRVSKKTQLAVDDAAREAEAKDESRHEAADFDDENEDTTTDLRMEMGLHQKMSQKMVLAPRMIQSMEILQLPIMALQERIQQELQENPVLEVEDDKHLNPRPSAQLAADNIPHVVPDILVERNDSGEYDVRLLDDWLPNAYISRRYIDLYKDKSTDPETRDYLKRKIQAAQWLQESIDQRRSTLEKVTRAIIHHQRAFLDKGPEHIEPLKMQQIADLVGVHVTTVSRAVDNKWVQTPRGIFPLKRFFGDSTQTASGEEVAWETIKQKLLEIIDKEDKSNPLSDEDLVTRLNEAGYPVARRTVTKYRRMANIPSSRQRKGRIESEFWK